MKRHLLCAFILSLLTNSLSVSGQATLCKIKIVKLELQGIQHVKTGELTNSLLGLAKLTTTILVDNSDIKEFDIKTDTACCTYAGAIFLTSHRYLLTHKAASLLSGLDIPLCCGVPIAVYVNDKEVYRALLWNMFSSFGNKTLTMTLAQDTLIVVNQFPIVPDIRNNILANKSPLPGCLLDK